MKRYRVLAAAMALLLVLGLAGCGRGAEQTESEVSIRETVTEADPQTAVDKIYEALPDARIERLTGESFAQLFPTLDGVAEEFYGAVSNPNGGLADVIIVKPVERSGARDTVREALRGYQDKRMREFENYDILNALTIATEAQVVDQGDYVLLLMLADNNAARDIIDQYLPL